jgi:hypothetical protein
MDPSLLSTAFKLEADSISALAGLAKHTGLDAATKTPPSLTIHTECDRLRNSGANGAFRVQLIVESMTADTAAHAARVELVRAAFVDGKDARLAGINGRAAVRLIDYGLQPEKVEVADGHSKTTLPLLVLAKRV